MTLPHRVPFESVFHGHNIQISPELGLLRSALIGSWVSGCGAGLGGASGMPAGESIATVVGMGGASTT